MKVRHIYIIGSQGGPFKIGIATNLRDRLSSIQTGSHVKVAVIWSMPVEGQCASTAEKIVHKTLSDHRLSGEWFDVSSAKAQAAIMRAVGRVKRKIQEVREVAEEPVRIALEAHRVEQLEKERIRALHAQQQAQTYEQSRRELVSRLAAGRRAAGAKRKAEANRLAAAAEKIQAWLDLTAANQRDAP